MSTTTCNCGEVIPVPSSKAWACEAFAFSTVDTAFVREVGRIEVAMARRESGVYDQDEEAQS